MSTTGPRVVAVGYDGSEESLTAVGVAGAEAEHRGLPLRLITAVDVFPYDSLSAIHHDGGYMPALVARAATRLDELAEVIRSEHSGLVVTTCVRALSPAALLVEESRDAELLVVGDHRGPLRHVPLGAVSDAVALHARCPVLVVRAAPEPQGPVVLGVDGSVAGELAIGLAFEEAQLLEVALEAVHAYQPGNYSDMPITRTEDDDQEERLLAECLAGWSEKYPDVRVERVLRRARASTALVEASRHAQLVVVGSRGRGGFDGLLLGSVSRTVLHKAACSVMVTRQRG